MWTTEKPEDENREFICKFTFTDDKKIQVKSQLNKLENIKDLDTYKVRIIDAINMIFDEYKLRYENYQL